MEDFTTGKWVILILMAVMGLLTHWLKQFIAVRKMEGTQMGFFTYWVRYWPETLVALTSGIAGFVFLYEMGQLSSVNAFGVGFIANSIADMLGDRVKAVIGGATTHAAK